jgi:hypothetical protein
MISLDARPRLKRFVRLRHDPVRGRWMLLAPERGFVLNGAALAIVQWLGRGTLRELGAQLGAVDDVLAFVEELAARGLVDES